MLGPKGLERNMRLAILLALAIVVVIAPLVGVFAFSPLVFIWGIQPYTLAVALSVMLAEALGIAALALFVSKARK